MNKILLPLVIVLALLMTTLMPEQGLALTKLEIERNKLKEAETIQKNAAQNIKDAQNKIKSIQVEKSQKTNDVKSLEKNISSLENEIDSINHEISSLDTTITTLDHQVNSLETEITSIAQQIDKTNQELTSLETQGKQVAADLKESERLLQEAKERILTRSSQLRKRIRLMYTNGKVAYLEVLLSSTSFTDFLDRFNILKSLVNQDKDILASNKKDHETVTVKIGRVKEQLAQLAALHEQQVAAKNKQISDKNKEIAARDKQVAAKNNQIAAKNSQVAVKDRQVAVKGQLSSLKETKKIQIAALNKEEKALAEFTDQQEKEMLKAAAIIAASKKSIAFYTGDKLGFPLEGSLRVTSNFGRRTDPITGKKDKMHNGIDFAAPTGKDILAAEAGRVITAGWVSGYGNTVILDHGNGLWTLYAHGRNGGIQVKVGDIVKRGQKISEVGSTGNSTGHHLHFEVRLNQKAVDPRNYLPM